MPERQLINDEALVRVPLQIRNFQGNCEKIVRNYERVKKNSRFSEFWELINEKK